MAVLLVHVMPEADKVVGVGEGHAALALRFGHWKEELENVLHPRAQRGGEVVKDEVRELLRDRPPVLDVMPQPHIVQAKVRRGPVGEVRDDHPVRFTPVLVEDDEVCDLVGTAGVADVLDDIVSPVDLLGVGEHEPHLLGKLGQPTARVPGGGHHDLGVIDPGLAILVIHV